MSHGIDHDRVRPGTHRARHRLLLGALATTALATTTLATTALGLGGAAQAEPPRSAAGAETAKVAAALETLRASPMVAKTAHRPTVRLDTRQLVEERLEELIDGAVLVSRAVAPDREGALVAAGVRRVERREDVAHHTLYEGRYYRLLLLVPEGPDESRVAAHLGQVLRLETALRSDHRAVLLDLRGSSS